MKSSILIVESDAGVRELMLRLLDTDQHDAVAVESLDHAVESMRHEVFSLIVTEVPRMVALGESDPSLRTAKVLRWVEQIRTVAPRTPIVLMTHQECDPAACEALLRGAASYVPRKLAKTTLLETVEQVLAVSRATDEATDVDQCVTRVKLEMTLPSHESLVPGVIAKIESAIEPLELFDEMVWTQIAMALDEAILNAMIHGNLEVASELREVDDGAAFWDKITERRDEKPYACRRTEVVLMATRSQAVFVVRDQGPGFDFHSLPDPTDPANLESIGGRGLLLITAFMDEVHHNQRGNELTMIKRKASGPRDPDEEIE